MNKHDLLPLAMGGFFFHDIHSVNLTIPRRASTTEICIVFECAPNVIQKEKPLSKEEEAVFGRLNEVWGDDEDGAYQSLYQHHKNLKAHAL